MVVGEIGWGGIAGESKVSDSCAQSNSLSLSRIRFHKYSFFLTILFQFFKSLHPTPSAPTQTLLDEQRRLLEEEKRLRAADVERLLAVQAAVSDELEKTREDLKREVEGRGEDVQWREEEMARLRAVLAKQAEEIEEKKKTIEARDKRIQARRWLYCAVAWLAGCPPRSFL